VPSEQGRVQAQQKQQENHQHPRVRAPLNRLPPRFNSYFILFFCHLLIISFDIYQAAQRRPVPAVPRYH
jgi:hypothetical protein